MSKLLTDAQRQKLESKKTLSKLEYTRLRNHYYALLKHNGFIDVEALQTVDDSYVLLKHGTVKQVQNKPNESLIAELEILQNFNNKYQNLSQTSLLRLRNLITRFLEHKFDFKKRCSVSDFLTVKEAFLAAHGVQKSSKQRKMKIDTIAKQSAQGTLEWNIENQLKAQENYEAKNDNGELLKLRIFQENCYRVLKSLNCHFYAIIRQEGFSYREIASYANMLLELPVHNRAFSAKDSLRLKSELESSPGLQKLLSYKTIYSLLYAIIGESSHSRDQVQYAIKAIVAKASLYKATEPEEEPSIEQFMSENTPVSDVVNNRYKDFFVESASKGFMCAKKCDKV
jgi:hypothetical protein